MAIPEIEYARREAFRMRLLCALVVTAFVHAAIGGCATGIHRDELLRRMQEQKSLLIVDVRSRGEFDRDHIPGAVQIPYSSIGSSLIEQGHAKSDPVILYCEHGPRAGIAGISLYLHGYDKVYSLEGHMKGWRAAGYPIEVTATKDGLLVPAESKCP